MRHAEVFMAPLFAKVAPTSAARWFHRRAERGDDMGQYFLGVMYDLGRGVPQDYAEAAKRFRKAADQGLPEAQLNLGVMYGKGRGVPQDLVSAWIWFDRAASYFVFRSVRHRAVRNCERIAAVMTPAQIAEAQRLAREWRPGR